MTSPRAERLRDLCAAAGIDGVLSPDIHGTGMGEISRAGAARNVNALTRMPLGKYRADPDTWALVETILRETVAVGRAEGVDLPPDAVERGLATIRSMPDHHMTSMGNDLLRGNRLELPWFAGKVVELGRKHGIPTPVSGFAYAALKLHAEGGAPPTSG